MNIDGVSSTNTVGNDFVKRPVKRAVAPRTRVQSYMAAISAPAMQTMVAGPSLTVPSRPHLEMPDTYESSLTTSKWRLNLDLLHRYSLGVFAVLFLLVASSGIQLTGSIMNNKIEREQAAILSLPPRTPTQPIAGYNTTVPLSELGDKLNALTSQPLTISVNGQPSVVQPDTIRSWLKVVENKAQDTAYIHVKAPAVSATLGEIGKQFTKDPTNQVTITHPDGTGGTYVVGKNGLKINDTTELSKHISVNLLSAKGMQGLVMPSEVVPFQAVTQAAFPKLLEVNVVTKQMYAYENGNLVRSFPISAGAPETPTPIGQFKIFSKLAKQDMSGFNPNGTKYFQPNVRWISYFLPGGYAVHGNYWRPLSWFGAINSSHGCVSLPDDQAKWVYDFAPIGTTVITHN